MGTSTQPRSLVRIDGNIVTPKEWVLERNAHGQLDQVTITLPISGNPDWASLMTPDKTLEVHIYGGFPSNPSPGGFTYPQLNERFAGFLDQLDPKFDEDVCTLTCRSFGALLVDTKVTTTQIATQTSQSFVNRVAAEHGLKPVFSIHGAPVSMHKVFSADYMIGIHNMREWDVLIRCAELDDADVWLTGNTLFYMSQDLVKRPNIDVKWLDIEKGLTTFSGNHAKFNRNIEVEVRSWSRTIRTANRVRITKHHDASGNVTSVQSQSSSRTVTTPNFGLSGSTAYTTSVSDAGTSTSNSISQVSNQQTGGVSNSGFTTTPKDSGKERYIFAFPNLSIAECNKRAMSLWKQISQHEYAVSLEMPMTPLNLQNTDITSQYNISNAPWKSFNHTYRTRRMTESFAVDRGWKIGVEGIYHILPAGIIYAAS